VRERDQNKKTNLRLPNLYELTRNQGALWDGTRGNVKNRRNVQAIGTGISKEGEGQDFKYDSIKGTLGYWVATVPYPGKGDSPEGEKARKKEQTRLSRGDDG